MSSFLDNHHSHIKKKRKIWIEFSESFKGGGGGGGGDIALPDCRLLMHITKIGNRTRSAAIVCYLKREI